MKSSLHGGSYARPELLFYRIDPEGATRVLFVSDYVHKKDTDEIQTMEESDRLRSSTTSIVRPIELKPNSLWF